MENSRDVIQRLECAYYEKNFYIGIQEYEKAGNLRIEERDIRHSLGYFDNRVSTKEIIEKLKYERRKNIITEIL